jgi:Ca-activated chloride channel family protein
MPSMMMRTRDAACLLALCLTAAEARAQAGLLVPTSSGRPDPAVLSLREMAVEVGIARGYARVNVRQVFENHTGSIQEGTYRFALPPSAAVGDFAVWDGLVRIPGVILEKQRARAIYRELTMQRIDPGLLQQGEEEDRDAEAAPAAGRPSGGALFSVTVAPIPGLATKRLEVQYQQEVPFIHGQGEFRLALKPRDGEPPVTQSLKVRVALEDGRVAPPATEDLPLRAKGNELTFEGRDVTLDRDLVVRFTSSVSTPLRLSAFRNPEGGLPDGLALAPWERPSEIPPEKDGFFLFEMLPPDAPRASTSVPVERGPRRAPLRLALLFDTSLSQRWAGLEIAYAHLVRILDSLGPEDRFALVPFDRTPAPGVSLQPATREAIDAAKGALRERPLGAGTDLPRAVAAGRALLEAAGGRIVLLTDGQARATSKELEAARGQAPLFSVVTGLEVPEAIRAASTRLLPGGAAEVEADLFFESVVAAEEEKPTEEPEDTGPPFTVTGGEPRIRDVYPVLLQPPAPGSLSGWVGRYAAPVPRLRFEVSSPLLAGGSGSLEAALPEKATDARDLPRRWARARVDALLMLIEKEGEKREWIEEIIALSKRYKFVTPYTAFLAAPRSLLRPRRIQPGDPVLRIECDPGIVSAVALFPFGLRLPLVRRPGTTLWEGRFLVPEGLKDGRYSVRVVLRDRSGARVTETKPFVLDGKAPEVRPDPLGPARAGDRVRLAVRTDEDVILLSARLGDGPPVPLRWEPASRRSVGTLRIPGSLSGAQELVFEAVDAAKNVGFARAVLEVRP